MGGVVDLNGHLKGVAQPAIASTFLLLLQLPGLADDMAPIPTSPPYPFKSASELSLEPFSPEASPNTYTSELYVYLRSLGLTAENRPVEESQPRESGMIKRTLDKILSRPPTPTLAVSPLGINDQLHARDAAPTKDSSWKGAGTIDPMSVNNKGMLALFGLVFGGLIVTAIWFFFWARNGGFVFREGDWEEYKSTVLRRKGKDGKTLSNATKTTDLGGDSVAGEYDQVDLVHDRMGRDNDVREYRHEKPARVGGLNRKADGSSWDHANTDRSEVMTEKPPPSKKKHFFERSKKQEKKKAKRQPSAAYSFAQGDDMSTQAESDMVDDRRHQQPRSAAAPPPHHYGHRASRSPHKPYRDREPGYSESGTTYSGPTTDDGDAGTKSYHHHIPGLSKGTRTETSFETEPRKPKRGQGGGYRRGGGRRRDSLSDSE
ncbi:MAG: hypothetical protein M1837_004022 [Sclerophora amabilis]|nr:MAG: hypothetical protein M1837_004022 [Sclerophora amabilis]